MNMIRHEDKRVQRKAPLTPIVVNGFQEQSRMRFDNKQSASLPRREGHKIRSGRRDESYRFQERPQRLKPDLFFEPNSARVKLVPFPMLFFSLFSFWETNRLTLLSTKKMPKTLRAES